MVAEEIELVRLDDCELVRENIGLKMSLSVLWILCGLMWVTWAQPDNSTTSDSDSGLTCPAACVCEPREDKTQVDCAGTNLTSLPTGMGGNARYL